MVKELDCLHVNNDDKMEEITIVGAADPARTK